MRARNIIQVTGTEEGHLNAFNDCVRLARDSDIPTTLTALVAGLNRRAIEQCVHFAVHSGVVATNDRVVAIPAESGGGKTTLTAALVKTGFNYITDEALVMSDTAQVLPYPKPFALTAWSAAKLGVTANGAETLIRSTDLGGQDHSRTGRLTDLIISSFGHDASTLEPVPKSRALATLVSLSFNHYKDPKRAFHLSSEVARTVQAWELRYDDPVDAAQLVSRSLS